MVFHTVVGDWVLAAWPVRPNRKIKADRPVPSLGINEGEVWETAARQSNRYGNS